MTRMTPWLAVILATVALCTDGSLEPSPALAPSPGPTPSAPEPSEPLIPETTVAVGIAAGTLLIWAP